ncbi:hypothetical protein [Clostridium cochlearium]|uniref:hypothetical protein n=1 Tax=Clostridium cochlearium TaxID=1494 RepID=UPI001A9AB95E|nr:hypothetical protein [Clostridium cochlearium]
MKIEKQGISVKKYVDDNKYKIFGLSFFDKELRMKEFEEDLSEASWKCKYNLLN